MHAYNLQKHIQYISILICVYCTYACFYVSSLSVLHWWAINGENFA